MSYPVYHGIKLAQSSEIQNVNIETMLNATLTAITGGVHGRVVFDTDNQNFKYFKDDGAGGSVVEELTSKTVHDALEAIVTVINGDSTIDGSFRKAIADVIGTSPESLDTLGEISNALNNDPDLYNTITALITSNIENAKNELRGAVSDSFDTLEEIEVKLNDLDSASSGGLATEQADRIAADQALQTEIDATQTGAGLEAAGQFTVNSATNFINAATSLKESDDLLDAALQAEKDRALAAESAIDTRLSSVESQAGGNIGDLSTLNTDAKDTLVNAINETHDDVVTEKLRAEGVEATLDADILAEVAAREAQDDVIEASLGLAADGSIGTGWADMSSGIWKMNVPMEPTTVKDLVYYLDGMVGYQANMLSAHETSNTTDFGKVTTAVGLNPDLSYAPDTAATFVATATSVANATSILDSMVKANTDGLYAEVNSRISMDGNITDGTGLNADGSYKGSGALITKVAAPSDLHGAVEGLAQMINTVMMPALGIQTAVGTTTGAIKADDYATMNFVINPSSVPNAIRQLDTQVKVNSDDITTEAATREFAINAGRLAVGLNSDGSYSPVAGANYIASASTVKSATELLDTQAKANADGLAAEVTDRTNADGVIQAELDASQVGAGLEDNGNYTPKADANYIASATTLKSADEALDAALKAEVDRSTSEDDAIKNRVDALEGQDAANNMGDLSLLQTDEKGSLTGAINEVDTQQGNIAGMVGLTETPAVGGATFSLDLSAANYVAGSASVQAALIAADAQIKSLDDAHKASWFTFKSSGAAASHTIAHNLNSEFVEVQLWVKSPDDGKYRMDIAEVVEQDNNTLEVVMNAPRDIKIIVEKRYA